MKKMLVVLLLLAPTVVWGQNGDFQPRLNIHEQWISKSDFGIGAWQNVPDFTREGPFRALFVAGPAYKTKGFWVEVMGGGFLDTEGRFDPVLNVRSVTKFGRFNLFNEALYATEARTLLLDPNLTFQVKGPFWIGLESDLLFKRGRNNLGFGPRVVLKFSSHATLALGYQRHTVGSHVLRSYFTLTF